MRKQEENKENPDPEIKKEETLTLKEDTPLDDEGPGYYLENEAPRQPDQTDPTKRVSKKQQRRKVLAPVDHEEVRYEPFSKSFYKEASDQKAMCPEEVRLLRKLLGDMKVRGKDCPKPIQNWFQCGLSDKLLDYLIDKKKYL